MSGKISILIPTYNAEKHIEILLKSIFSQKLNKYSIEVIVIDSSSTDKTIEIINNLFPQVKTQVIGNSDFDHGGTRNILAKLSTGDFLLFMTQDAIPVNENLLLNLLSVFTNPNVLISYARQIPKEDASELEVFARGFNYPNKSLEKGIENLRDLGIKTFFNSNVCSVYRRETFEKFNGFPEKVILNEDMILASKVILNGYKVVYNSEAKVYHSHNYSLLQQFKRYFDIGMAFNQTSYLLENVSNESEGIRMIKQQQKFLIKNKLFHIIPYSIVESIFKYAGYLLGKKHHKIPESLKRKFSAYMK